MNCFLITKLMDSRKIKEMLEYVYYYSYPKKCTKNDMIKEFGEDNYTDFQRLCFSYTNFAYENPDGTIILNTDGIKEIYRLKEEHSRTQQTWLMILATTVVAIAALLQSYAFVYGSNNEVAAVESWRITIAQLIGLGIVIFIAAKIYESIKPRFLKII